MNLAYVVVWDHLTEFFMILTYEDLYGIDISTINISTNLTTRYNHDFFSNDRVCNNASKNSVFYVDDQNSVFENTLRY